NDARGIGLSLLAMSVAAQVAGEPRRAIAVAEGVLALFERTDDGPGRAAAVVQLGFLAADTGQTDAALELEERGLFLWKAFASTTVWLPPILLELAVLDQAVGEPERARGRIREAIEILTKIGDGSGVEQCEELLRTGANSSITVD